MMHLHALIIAFLFALNAVPDFSGIWVFDAAKSGVKSAAGSNTKGGITLVIRHKNNNLEIDKQVDVNGKKVEWGYRYILDGQEHLFSSANSGDFRYTARWNSSELELTGTKVLGNKSFPNKQTYSLSPDGKMLTVTETLGTQGPASRQVYSKK